ncbi:DNA-binding CsgD family transcriptional regulator [Streptomyces aurantiacus]|uniref:helix-turn-helix transcriptional regulator n=1 Tax=Streptomyces aurantiacus TaxID=47760 RepID=UPI0027903F6F|nr:LuxR family transcriptional regulator [Streptomyces aurantiacus]MDQ0779159.1 DNA-binding CsgD family transcriptional regulator [Streptomyces aurantiacus]
MRDGGSVIGRDSEIRAAARTLLSPGASARALLVVGAAGTGKTAVLEQARLVAVEEGARVLQLRCHDGESAPGSAALTDGVHSALTKVHSRRSTVRISSARRIPRQPAGRHGELTLLSALSEVLTDAARDTPFALMIDDVERLPPATAAALGLLLRVFRPAGVSMVMAGRPVRPRDDGAAQLAAAADQLLELPPLRPADVEALVVRRLGRPVEPALVTAVLRALGPMAGTPEAVLSVLDSMAEHGDLLELGGHVCLTEPEQALRLTTDMAQLRRLCWPDGPPDATALAAAAAVARTLEHAEIRLDDLHRLKPGGPRRAGLLDRALTPLVGDGILVVDGDGRASFAVPALAAALRALPTHHDVSSLHALITRSLSDRLGAETAGGGYPRLADHVTAAGAELDDALAVDVLLAAARTDARSDWPRSVRAYSSALRRLAPYDRRTPGVLRESAELSLRHADHAGALALGEPLLACRDASLAEQDRDRDRDQLAYVTEVWALAALHEHRLPYADGTGSRSDHAPQHLSAVGEFAALAGPYGLGGVTRRPGDGAHDVPVTGPRPGSGPLPSPAELRLLAAAAGSRAGLLNARDAQDTLDSLDSLDSLDPLNAMDAMDAMPPDADGVPVLDRLRNAATHADLADALAAVLGDRYTGAGNSTAARYHAMVRAYLRGDWDQALSSARRIEARSRTRGTEAATAQPARALAADIHCARGELGHARAWLDLIPDTVAHPLVAWARLGLRYWSGQVEQALEGARADVRRARGSGLLSGIEKVLLRHLTYALLEDMPDAMREALDELEALHEEVASPMTREAVLLGRGLVHCDVDSALAALRSVHQRGDAYLSLLCHLCLMELGDDPERRMAEASRSAQSLGIGRATRTTLGHMARRRSLVLPRARPAKDRLSEADVGLTVLVSDGATNRQIAARLASSEKTVERRLTQLFQRTGCRSRAELAAAWLDGSLAGRGLVPDGAAGARGARGATGTGGAAGAAGGSLAASGRAAPNRPNRR